MEINTGLNRLLKHHAGSARSFPNINPNSPMFKSKLFWLAAGVAGGYWLATSPQGKQIQKQVQDEATRIGNQVTDGVQSGIETVNSQLSGVRSQVSDYSQTARTKVTDAKGYLVNSIDSVQTNINRGLNNAKSSLQDTTPQFNDQIQSVENNMEEHLTAAQNKLRSANNTIERKQQQTLNGVHS